MRHALLILAALLIFTTISSAGAAQASTQGPLKVFLDCSDCFQDFLRSEIDFVDYVRDRTEADVHVLITRSETGAGGREYTAAFIGRGVFAADDQTLKAVTTSDAPEDVRRRQIATTLRIGLLHYVARNGVPAQLDVSVELDSNGARPEAGTDRWNNWVFSLRGSTSFQGEESSKETNIGARASADRITPDWKITLGGEYDRETQEFDLDEDEPGKFRRSQRELQFLVVKSLGEHWSAGVDGGVSASTFDNTRLQFDVAPAIEYNFFPYAMYARRQFRALYAVGVRSLRYNEETLFGKTRETLPGHNLSVSFEQRERWGSLEAGVEWSQYLHDLSKSRLEANGDMSVRIIKGLSVSAEIDASRIRDQISLPSRGATPEEVLLRLRRLLSGYQYDFQVSLTYTFGSIFSSVVNPRFGQ